MMKTSCLLFLVTIVVSKSFAQTIPINGTVKNTQGQPVPLVFVRDVQHYYATYADSTGNFMLKADPSSVLIAIASGYEDTRVKIEGKTTVNIVMPAGTSSATAAGNSAGLAGGGDGSNAGVPYIQTLVTQAGSTSAISALSWGVGGGGAMSEIFSMASN